jgi:hypothetical protein
MAIKFKEKIYYCRGNYWILCNNLHSLGALWCWWLSGHNLRFTNEAVFV